MLKFTCSLSFYLTFLSENLIIIICNIPASVSVCIADSLTCRTLLCIIHSITATTPSYQPIISFHHPFMFCLKGSLVINLRTSMYISIHLYYHFLYQHLYFSLKKLPEFILLFHRGILLGANSSHNVWFQSKYSRLI